MKVAVVGHVEVVDFVRVKSLPTKGAIVHASDAWTEAAGGGGVAAVQLAKLAGECTLFTALGDDDRGRAVSARLAAHGVRVVNAWRNEPQRRAITFIDDDSERTITVIGARHQPELNDALPWDDLSSTDAVYFTAGAPEVLRDHVRKARVVVATARVLTTLEKANVALDAIVRSAHDPSEPDPRGRVPVKLVAATEGSRGGSYVDVDLAGGVVDGRWDAAPLPGPPVDAYGCGDSFAAGLAFALGRGDATTDALAFAAKCGAASLTGRGPFGGQIELRRGS